jgi:predicted nucleic acid-binding protein
MGANISTQVLGEFYSAMGKYGRAHAEIFRMVDEMIRHTNVAVVTLATVKSGLALIERYGYSYWDSLLLATAVENHCEILYSEDMQHNQLVEGKLKILNPFRI